MNARITEGDGDPRHGTENGYGNLYCRCRACQDAHAAYYFRLRPIYLPVMRAKYRLAREAGYSPAESVRRKHWSDPLAARAVSGVER